MNSSHTQPVYSRPATSSLKLLSPLVRARQHVHRILTAAPLLTALPFLSLVLSSCLAQSYAGQGCIATIKSRSVPISPSGAWAIPNVPVDGAKYRVHVVCAPTVATGGAVYGGLSDPISLVPGGTEAIPVLPVGVLSEQPNKIGLVNIGQNTLSSLGSTLQLQTQLLYPSGEIYDGTASSNGTVYFSSNTAVATVSTEGLVTAVGPGTVVITSTYDGLVSTVQLTSFSALDSDGDGMPDAWEIANGLNPYDPTDAALDPDGDGLTNLQEYLLGTNPHVADTDGDGLNDGDEIKAGTNPLVADTDGDGLGDGDEIRLGTNPLNPDTDGDGIPDGIEVKLGLNPLVPDATTTVTGHVTQANGSPYPGGDVTVLTYFAATTDQTGAFLITHVPVTLGNLVVAARAVVNGSVLAGSSTATPPLGGATTDVGTIQLGQSSGQVSGIVTNGNNQPVTNVAVTVTGGSDTRTTSTDATGAYAVVGLQSGTVNVTVFDPNTSLRGQASGTLTSSATGLTLNVKLAAYGTVSGSVLNAAGTAVGAGITVTITGSLGATTTTDALGHYSFSFVPLGGIAVNATDANGNRGQSGATVTATSQTINLNVQYIARGTVAGTVYDSTHTAVAGLPVALSNAGTFSQSLTTTTNSLGAFSFTNIYAGTINVSSQNAANNTAGNASTTISTDGQSVTTNITLTGAGNLNGTIYRADGATVVPGATVTLNGSAYTTTADANGKYSFTNVPLAGYNIIAKDSSTGDQGQATTTLSTTGATVTANISLLGLGSLTVTVNDAGNNIVSGAVVNISTSSGYLSQSQSGVTGSDGTIAFSQQLAGSAQVKASNPATNLVGSGTAIITANGKAILTVTLQAAGAVQGTVYAANGATPVPGLTVIVGTQQATTDANGNYSVTTVPVASYTVIVQDAYKNILSQNNNVNVTTQGQVVTANFIIVGRGTVNGHVYNPDGTPAANVPVTVTSSRGGDNNPYGTQTDVNGLYTIPNIPDGGYLAVSQSRGTSFGTLYGTATGTVAGDGNTYTTDIHLSSATVPADLNLYDANGQVYEISARGALETSTYFDFNQFGGNGTNVDGMALSLVQNGTETPFTGYPYGTLDLAGQQFSVSQSNVAGLNITRKVYVPNTAYFARYIEQLTNPTTSDITVDLKLTSYLHQVVIVTSPNGVLTSEYDAPKIISTSSGDTLLNSTTATNPDYWVTIGPTIDQDPFLTYGFTCRCLAPFADVFDGPGATYKNTNAVYTPAPDASTGTLIDTYPGITVHAGQTVEILHYYSQENSFAGANATAARLVQLPPEALTGMTAADVAAVPNFALPANAISTVAALPSLTNTVSGYVYASDQATPIPAAGVSLQSVDPIFGRLYTTNSDGTGAYLFTGAPNGANGIALPAENFTVNATHPITGAVSPNFSGSFTSGTTSAAQNISFTNTGILTGTVSRNQTVLNVSGTVTLSGGTFLTTYTYPIAADGTYTITGLPPGTYIVVAAVTNTQLTGVATGTITAGNTTTLNITIGTAGTVQGTVTRPDGSFAVNDTVYLRIPNAQPLQTLVDTGGHYLFTDVPTGNYTIDSYDPQTNASATASIVVTTNSATTQNLALLSSGIVKGAITANDGSSVSGLVVTLTSTTSSGTQTLSVTSDSGGNYTFNSVKPGAIQLRVTNTNGLQGTANGSLPLAGQTVTINLQLLAVGSVTGTVFQGDGVTPATGIQVTISPPPLTGSAVTTTDSSGKYSYSNQPIGGFTVYANNLTNNDLGQASSSISTNGQVRTVNITLNGYGTLVVKVVDSTSKAVANAAVIVQNNTQGKKYTATADSTGTATFANIYAGAYNVSATDPVTGLNAYQSGTLPSGTTQNVTLTLQAVGTISGVIYGVDGKTPASGITVSVQNGPSTLSASDGTYTLKSVPLGYLLVRVTDANGVLRTTGYVNLQTAGATISQNFTLIGIGTVHGVVHNTDGTVLENATLLVVDNNPTIGVHTNTTTGGDGTYTVSGLGLGSVAVTVQNLDQSLAGYGTTTLSTDGSSVELDIQIVSSAVALPITLNDADGFPYEVNSSGSFYQATNIKSAFYQADQLTFISNGNSFTFGDSSVPTTALQSLGGRQVEINQPNVLGLNVTRKIYVPADGYFARHFEELQNTSSSPITVQVSLGGTERYDLNSGVYINSNSNGTSTLDKTTQWIVDDDDTGAKPWPQTQPAVGKIFAGTGAAITPSTVSSAVNGGFQGNNNYYYYLTETVAFNTVTVPANSTVSFLFFDAQENASGTAKTAAKRLVQLPAEALAGLSSTDLATVVNFAVPATPLGAITAPPTGAALYGAVYAGDGQTPIPTPTVYLESTDLYYGWGTVGTSSATGSYSAIAEPQTGYAAFAVDPATGVQSVSATGTISSNSTQQQDIPFTGTGILSGLVTPTGQTTIGSGYAYAVWYNNGTYSGSTNENFTSNGQFGWLTLPAGYIQLSVTAYSPNGGGYSLTGNNGISVGITANQTTSLTLSTPATGNIVATVKNFDGTAAVGASVYINTQGYQYASGVTGANGTVTFSAVPTGAYTLQSTDVSTKYTATAAATVTQDTTSAVTLNYIGKGSLTVTVKFTNGGVGSGAQLEIATATNSTFTYANSLTDGNGQYTFTNVPTGAFSIRAFYPNQNFYTTSTGNFTANGATQQFSATLTPVGTISGTLTNADGSPSTGTYVCISDLVNQYGFCPQTDSAGNYAQFPVPADRVVNIVANLPNNTTNRTIQATANNQQVPGDGQTLTVNLRFPGLATVHVTALQANGMPYTSGNIGLKSADGTQNYNQNVASDGTATFTSVVEGTLTARMYVCCGNFNAGSKVFTVKPSDDNTTVQVTINTSPSGTVQGQVYAADGTTVIRDNYVVNLNDIDTGSSGSDYPGNGQGYSFDGVQNGASGYQLTAQLNAGGPKATATGNITTPNQTDTKNLTIPVSSISGTVYLYDGVTPVPNAQINVLQTIGVNTSSYNTTADANGTFQLSGPVTGTITLTAYDSNDVSGMQTATLATDTAILTGVKVSLGAVGTVTGTIYDATGNPVTYTQVDVQSSGNNTGFSTEVQTDGNGNYIATDVPVGNITIYVNLPDGTSKSGTGTLVNNGDTVTINIGAPTSATGVVFGTVYDSNQNPAPGAIVSVTESAANQTATATTDSNGLYSATGFSAGTVVVSATLTDGSSPSPVTGIISDATVPIEVDLGITDNGNVSGLVYDANGNPLPNVNVNVASSGDTSTSYGETTGGDGSFYFFGIAPGTITFTVTDNSGNLLATATGNLPFGGNLTMNVNIPNTGSAKPHATFVRPALPQLQNRGFKEAVILTLSETKGRALRISPNVAKMLGAPSVTTVSSSSRVDSAGRQPTTSAPIEGIVLALNKTRRKELVNFQAALHRRRETASDSHPYLLSTNPATTQASFDSGGSF